MEETDGEKEQIVEGSGGNNRLRDGSRKSHRAESGEGGRHGEEGARANLEAGRIAQEAIAENDETLEESSGLDF